MKILEYKCFGVDDSMVNINDLYQHILFKIDNGNYIYKKIHKKSDSGVVNKSPLYYTDEDSYNLENYQNKDIFYKEIEIYQLSNDGGIFDKVSYDETKLVEQYYREHNLGLFENDKVQLFEIKKPYIKCDLEYVRLIGVISRDEYECETEIDTQIVVRFGLKSGETISVNRVITEVNNKRILDNFYYSKRDNIDDGGRKRLFIFSDNIWSTKEVFEKDNKELGKYCDYLNYLHCGFEKTFDRYDYYLGNNWTYNNDKNGDLGTTNSIVERVEEDFN